MKRFSSSLKYSLLCLLTSMVISCQSQTVSGVYAGVELSLSPLIGGGMNREDIVLVLRPDGTFNDATEEANWKTASKGKYTVSGKEVTLQYNIDNSKRTFTINSKGNLNTATGYTLVKMDKADKVPPGNYSFTHASGSGGGMSNVAYVGASGGTDYYFDGKGQFTTGKYSTVMVAGDHIGGGGSNESKGAGTYTFKDGELTLSYKDGTVKKHSFFVSTSHTGGDPTMAAIDGSIFFMDEEKEKARAGTNAKPAKETTAKEPSTTATASNSNTLPAATTLLDNIRAAHGGEAIDKVRNLRFTGTAQGMQVKGYTDLERQWSRIEFRQGNTLLMVEQWEGDKGWQWLKGIKTPVTAERAKEMKYQFYAGIGALQQKHRSLLSSGKVSQVADGYALTYNKDGYEFAYGVMKDYTIIAEVNKLGKEPSVIQYSNYRTVDGVRFPFTETHTTGNQKLTLTVSELVFNDIPANAWSEPQ